MPGTSNFTLLKFENGIGTVDIIKCFQAFLMKGIFGYSLVISVLELIDPDY